MTENTVHPLFHRPAIKPLSWLPHRRLPSARREAVQQRDELATLDQTAFAAPNQADSIPDWRASVSGSLQPAEFWSSAKPDFFNKICHVWTAPGPLTPILSSR